MIKDNYELEILVNGKPVKEYFHEGKFYIEGKEETTYSLRVKNNGYRKIVVVPTVDGLNVLTGKIASISDRGYIVNAYSLLVIDGWRTSDKEIAEFFFSDPGKSYADKKGKGNNIGVIGCAVFKEKQVDIFNNFPSFTTTANWPLNASPFWTTQDVKYSNNSETSGVQYKSLSYNYDSDNGQLKMSVNDNGNITRACYNMTSQELGTGFGDRKKSEVTTVSFDRESHPSEIFEVFYNTRKQLEKMGINLNSRPQYVAPSAFPADNGYCIPPEKVK